MFGRKYKSRIVYVDGIPIESSTFDAGESGSSKKKERADAKNIDPTDLSTLDPKELFWRYDFDESGGIDFDEFKALLKDLKIEISEPKALAYFKKCDPRRKGHISFEEFRLALYTCDPSNPSRTGGFCPTKNLSPKDLFEMFEREEGSGVMNRDGFADVLEFLNMKMPLHRMENIFAEYEDRELEVISYFQFKKIWLSLIDVREELRNRNEVFNRMLPTSTLAKKLDRLITAEDKKEAETLSEANKTLDAERIYAQRRYLVQEAKTYAKVLLTEAIDAAGQVYVFGKGAFNRFDGEPKEPDFVDFVDFQTVMGLWKERVQPSPELIGGVAETTADTTDKRLVLEKISQNKNAKSPINASTNSTMGGVDDRSETASLNSSTPGGETASTSSSFDSDMSVFQRDMKNAAVVFSNRQIALNTAWLWGRRVQHVSCGASVAYALTDSGETFCWGGSKRKWNYFYSSEIDHEGNPTRNQNNHIRTAAETRGIVRPTSPPESRPETSRTEMLKLTIPSRKQQDKEDHQHHFLREKFRKHFIKPIQKQPTQEEEQEKLYQIGLYYDLLNEDPEKPMPNLKWLEESVEPEINVNDLILSLEIRGIYKGHETRQQLVKTLGECLLLELECMGKDFSAWYKDFDKKARQLRRLHRENDVQKICFRTKTVWDELKELKQNIANAEQLEFEQASKQYFEVRNKILIAKAKMERQARESVEYAPIEDDRKDFHFNGLTARGPKLKHYQGRDALSEISVGSRHALAIHQTGKLFAWGVGSFGRLGHAGGTKDADDLEAWHKDYVKPTIVPSLEKTRFRSVACGFSHSMALSTRGQLYVWGSATAGKLGISHEEPSTPAQQQAFDIECFCFTPTILKIPGGRSIRKIACGPSHSAAISTNGELFVWGSGDGGRLGLGDERVIGQDFVPRHGNLGIVAVPTRVDFEPIASEHIVDVSCGIAHTAVISAVRSDKSALNGSNGSLNLTAKGYSGGKVFVAGSCFALGQFIPKFTQVKALESISIQSIACGASHTAAVSVEGELYTWGRNKTGCTGHSILLHEVAEPTLVDCMYRVPRDITRDTKYPSMASQSSQNAAFGPGWAITSDATPEGERSYSQTQQENCPYWEVKLGLRSRIEKIRVIVRKPPKEIVGDTLANFNYFILISDLPFEPEPGKYSLFKAKNQSIFMKVSNPFANYALATRRSPSRPGTSAGLQSTRGGSRPSTSTSRPGTSLVVAPPFEWEVPAGTFGRFVRIQLDSNNMLTLDRVEIIGYEEKEFRGSRVDSVTCSENLTIAICRPLKNQAQIRERYLRSLQADPASKLILQQYITFQQFKNDTVESLSNSSCKVIEAEVQPESESLTYSSTSSNQGMDKKEREERMKKSREERRRRRLEKKSLNNSNTTATVSTLPVRAPSAPLTSRLYEDVGKKDPKRNCLLCTPKKTCAICDMLDAFPKDKRLELIPQMKQMSLEEVCESLLSIKISTAPDEDVAINFDFDALAKKLKQIQHSEQEQKHTQKPSMGQLLTKLAMLFNRKSK